MAKTAHATLLIAVTATLLAASAAVAQPGGSSERRERLFRSWDANGDGKLVKDEVPERYHRIVSSAADRVGGSFSDGVVIDDLLGRRAPSESLTPGTPEQPRESSRTNSTRDAKPTEPAVKGFGVDAKRATPSGFGAAGDGDKDKSSDKASRSVSDDARRYASSLMRRYDRNRNGQLEKEEWSRIRGDPVKSDANGDGVITLTELINRVASYRSRSGSFSSRSTSSKEESDKRTKSSKKPAKADDGERKSYRFKPATERLPSGLPSWFKQRDADGDGQVAMHEYSDKWSNSRVRDFQRYDKNGDGLITPDECTSR